MSSFLQYILSRLSEQSTYQGLIAILATIGVNLSPDLQQAIISFSVAAVGLVAIIFREKKVAVVSSTPAVAKVVKK